MDDGSLDGTESGGQLRAKLEAALAANKTLTEEVLGFKAEKVISAKGFKFVTPEDLHGVGLDELETKAAEVEAAKAAQRESVVKQVLADKGLQGDQLDAALKNLLSPEQAQADAAIGRLAEVGRIQGNVPSTAGEQGLFGKSRIRAALAKK